MGVTRLQVKKDNSKRKTGSTAKNKGAGRAGRKGAARKDGVDRLRWAADRRVGRDSEKLADLLSEKALEGDLASTKVLVALADGKSPAPVKQESAFKKLLADLAVEPEWKGEEEQGLGTEGLGTRD